MKRPDDDSLARQRSGHRERLRQRLLQHGISSLHSYEVLEYLQTKIGRNPKESLVVFYLNSARKVAGVWEIKNVENHGVQFSTFWR